MSVAEIKNSLRSLSSDELADIAEAVALLRTETGAVREVKPSDADVPRAMDAVFEKHRDLFRRLAQ